MAYQTNIDKNGLKLMLLKPEKNTKLYDKTNQSSNHSNLAQLIQQKPDLYLPLPFYLPLAMDTNDVTAVKRNARATISKLYDARVAATIEKIDPLCAKANAALKDVDNFEVEKLDGQWGADTVPHAAVANQEEVPLLTLRQLMPGSTGDEDEDRDLDNAFKANKIEFIVVQRPLTTNEKTEGNAIEDPADVDLSLIHI